LLSKSLVQALAPQQRVNVTPHQTQIREPLILIKGKRKKSEKKGKQDKENQQKINKKRKGKINISVKRKLKRVE